MSVVKMELMTLSGGEMYFDDAVKRITALKDFAIADAHEILSAQSDFSRSPTSQNPYSPLLAQAENLLKMMSCPLPDAKGSSALQPAERELPPTEEITRKFGEYTDLFASLTEKKSELETEHREFAKTIGQLEHLADASVDLDTILSLKYFHFRFGCLPRESYETLDNYVVENNIMYFFPSSVERREVWGIYITPTAYAVRVDNLFATLGFRRIHISDKLHGKMSDALNELREDDRETVVKLGENEALLKEKKAETEAYVRSVYPALKEAKKRFGLRGKCQWRKGTFTMCGWIPASDADCVRSVFDGFEGVSCSVEPPPETGSDEDGERRITPPTLLKNFFLFRPFEQFVTMYGSPTYGEFDPTPVVALSYMLFFGMMFGDVGQGAVLILIGAAMWFLMKMNLGRIISLIGVSSMCFGFFYGSVFGVEELIHGFNPMENIDTTLLSAVFIGVGTVVLCMLLNIINGIKRRSLKLAVFSPNGAVGLVLYLCGVVVVLGMFGMITNAVPMKPVWAVIIVALALLFAAEPIIRLITHRRLFPDGAVDFAFGSFFELFESVLSYMTNTISFIRLGAFALSHVGMMTVVFLLAGTGEGSVGSIPVLVIGNLFVIVFEGLIVGIQVLRLEFYELFGRFYEGEGEKFVRFGEEETETE